MLRKLDHLLVIFISITSAAAYGGPYPLSALELRAIQSDQITKSLTNMGASKKAIACELNELSKVSDSQLLTAYEYDHKHGDFPGWWRKKLESIGRSCNVRPDTRKMALTEMEARALENEELHKLSRKYGFSKNIEACLIRESNATPGNLVLQDMQYRFANRDTSPSNLRRIENMVHLCNNH